MRRSAAFLVVGMTLGVGACSSGDAVEPDPLTDAQIAELFGPSEVVYHVTGDASYMPKGMRDMTASVTVATPTGTEQADVRLPLRNKAGQLGLHMEFEPGEFLYISAQNEDKYGSVTCQIVVDGEVVSENTSNAAYGIASCKGRS